VEGSDPFVREGQGLRFYGHEDGKAVVHLRPYVPSPEATSDAYPYLLTTGRVLEQWHTGTMTMRIAELARAAGEATFEINEQDAWLLKIEDGDRVEVTSRYGSARGPARVSAALRRGVLFAPFYDARLLVNLAVADHVDPFSRQPAYKVTAVAVRRVEG
jgi:nitrate reductase NapA